MIETPMILLQNELDKYTKSVDLELILTLIHPNSGVQPKPIKFWTHYFVHQARTNDYDSGIHYGDPAGPLCNN